LIDGSPLQTTHREFCLWWLRSFENAGNSREKPKNYRSLKIVPRDTTKIAVKATFFIIAFK